MKRLLAGGMSVVLWGSLTSFASAQIPGGAGATAGATAGGIPAPAVAPAAPAAPNNFWSYWCMTPEQKAACKAKFCASALGQLINNSLAGPSAMTGGVIPQCCPPPGLNPANALTQPPDSALGAAAAIQKDEAGAKARRAAVRYLGTVDCNWWPEAQAALINALRADRNECVRWEAAMALSRGCCCKKKVIQALVYAVSGSTADDNPPERCERVIFAASIALDHCLECYTEVVPVPPAKSDKGPRPEVKPEVKPEGNPVDPDKKGVPNTNTPAGGTASTKPLNHYDRIDQLPLEQVVQNARQVLATSRVVATRQAVPTTTAGKGGLVNLITASFTTEHEVQSQSPPIMTVQASVDSASPVMVHQASEVPSSPYMVQQTTTVSPPRTFVPPTSPVAMPQGGVPSAMINSVSPVLPPAPGVVITVYPPEAPAVPARRSIVEAIRDRMSGPKEPAVVESVPAIVTPSPFDLDSTPMPPASSPRTIPVQRQGASTPVSALPAPVQTQPATPVIQRTAYFAPMTENREMQVRFLHDAQRAADPLQREAAVRQLSITSNAESVPVVQLLLDRSTRDESPLVRAACLRGLMTLKVKNDALRQVLVQTQDEWDPRVRLAAREVREWLQTPTGPTLATPVIRIGQQ